MKLTKSFSLLVTALVLCSGAVGCKKGIQKVTPLPVGETGASTRGNLNDSPLSPIGDGTSSGIPMGTDAWNDADQDRIIFAAQTVYFEFDQSNVKPSEISKLQTVANRMQAFPGKGLRIEGHCDERGTEEYNRSLGERRALSVREHLIRLGMNANNVVTVSFGEDRPADPGRTADAWAKNRRGEIILLSPRGGAAAQ